MTDPAALPDFGLSGSGLPDSGLSGSGSSSSGLPDVGLPDVGQPSAARDPAGPQAVVLPDTRAVSGDGWGEDDGDGWDAGAGYGGDTGAADDGLLPLRDRVARALAGGGHPCVIDGDGDVAVAVQDQKLFVRCVDSVPPLIRVFGQWLMDDLPADELARLRAANAVTASVNLVKASVHADRLVVAVDLVVGDDFHLPSLLDASLDAVLGCVRSWHDTVLELIADPGTDAV